MAFVWKIKKFSFLELAGVVFHQLAGMRLTRLRRILGLMPVVAPVKRIETQR
jgi:hypothetical protein